MNTMKTQLLFILLIFSISDLFSQIDKGSFIISAEGHYAKGTSVDGVTSNLSQTDEQYLNTVTSVGYFFGKGFVAGVGLDYNWEKKRIISEMYISKYSQIEQMDIKSRALLPNIYAGYYFRIYNKLYLNTSIKFSYGKVKSEIKSFSAANEAFNNDPLYYNDTINGSHLNGSADSLSYVGDDVRSSIKNSTTEIFDVTFYPEVTYFLTKNFGASLSLGGIEYSVLDGKIEDNSHWAVNFNHNYWKFGIKILF
jgi:hypothetical protein